MGARPSKAEISAAISKRLQWAAKTYGGAYNAGTGTTYAYVTGPDWRLSARPQYASNGECCLRYGLFRDGRSLQVAFSLEELFRTLDILKIK